MELNRRSWLTWKLGTGFLLLSVAVFVFALSAGLAPCATVLAQSTSCNVGDTEVFSGTIGVGAEPSAGNAFDVMQSSGSTWPPEWRTAGEVKTSDETVNNSSTLQDDDELFWSAAANAIYIVTGDIVINSGTTPDIKVAWTVPSGTTIDGMYIWNRVPKIAEFDESTTVNFDTSTTDSNLLFTMTVVTSSSAGDVHLQWAQNTMDASDTIVRKGSGFTITRLD